MINKERKFFLMDRHVVYFDPLESSSGFSKGQKICCTFLLPIEILERFSPIKRLKWIFPDRKYQKIFCTIGIKNCQNQMYNNNMA